MIRTFFPGSEWLYFKIYTGIKNADKIASNFILLFIEKLNSEQIIDKWFFIRYADPNNHLRLRLRLTSSKDFSNFFRIFNEVFADELSKGTVYDIKIDTYSRELERYSSDRIDLVESIFHMDSICVCKIMAKLNDDKDRENLRWQLGLLLIDNLLESFKYDINSKIKLLKEMSDSFLKEFGFTHSSFTKQLNDRYRINRTLIENIISQSDKRLVQYANILEQRKFAVTEIANRLLAEYDTEIVDVMLNSLVHMTMNRLFMSHNRANEMIIYYLLYKFYLSFKGKGGSVM